MFQTKNSNPILGWCCDCEAVARVLEAYLILKSQPNPKQLKFR